MAATKAPIDVRVKRQDGPDAAPYWHDFRVPWAPQHNVLSVLMEIRRHPVTADGKRVAAPVWDSSCLEEVCGACTMLVNGKVRQGCTALVDQLERPITLEPATKFPVVRDLMVDRSRMFQALKRVHAWIPIDGTYDLGPAPRASEAEQQLRYALSRCITCGCCLEEVCGACTMLVNGKVRQGCTALVDQLERPITLEPATKFPVVRDLMVDRSRMFQALKRVHAWIPIDGTYDLGPAPRASEAEQQLRYSLSRCITCGCCLEVCPQVSKGNDFVGAAAIGQTLLQNLHPTGKLGRDERLDALMGPGGIADCGNAQNCVEACPKDIPLTEAIAEMGRQTTLKMLKDMFRR